MKAIWQNQRGLTLLELCFTLLIIGLLIAVASPRLAGSYQNLRLKTASEEIAGQVKFAMARAAFSGIPRRLRVWQNRRGYSIEEQDNRRHGDQPAWNRLREWRETAGYRLPEDFRINTRELQIEFDPAADELNTKITLLDNSGKGYEIHIKKQVIEISSITGSIE